MSSKWSATTIPRARPSPLMNELGYAIDTATTWSLIRRAMLEAIVVSAMLPQQLVYRVNEMLSTPIGLPGRPNGDAGFVSAIVATSCLTLASAQSRSIFMSARSTLSLDFVFTLGEREAGLHENRHTCAIPNVSMATVRFIHLSIDGSLRCRR